MLVSAAEFCSMYIEILEEIDRVIHPDVYPAMRKMYVTDPHDLVTPSGCFTNRNAAYGFVFCTLLNLHKQIKKESARAAV